MHHWLFHLLRIIYINLIFAIMIRCLTMRMISIQGYGNFVFDKIFRHFVIASQIYIVDHLEISLGIIIFAAKN